MSMGDLDVDDVDLLVGAEAMVGHQSGRWGLEDVQARI